MKVTRGEGDWGRAKGATGVKYMVMEEDQSLGGEHSMEYTDIVLQSCTPEIYIVLLTNVTPIN